MRPESRLVTDSECDCNVEEFHRIVSFEEGETEEFNEGSYEEGEEEMILDLPLNLILEEYKKLSVDKFFSGDDTYKK
jgi:hypothetical protein